MIEYRENETRNGEGNPTGLETLAHMSPGANPFLSLQKLEFLSQCFPSLAQADSSLVSVAMSRQCDHREGSQVAILERSARDAIQHQLEVNHLEAVTLDGRKAELSQALLRVTQPRWLLFRACKFSGKFLKSKLGCQLFLWSNEGTRE